MTVDLNLSLFCGAIGITPFVVWAIWKDYVG